jgi:hypothetical protein
MNLHHGREGFESQFLSHQRAKETNQSRIEEHCDLQTDKAFLLQSAMGSCEKRYFIHGMNSATERL